MSAPPPLKKVKQGIDPAVQSAYEAAQGVMGSLREKGMEEVTIDAATATALGDALELAGFFFTKSTRIAKAHTAQEAGAGIVQDGIRRPRSGYVALARTTEEGEQEQLVKKVLEGCCTRIRPGTWVGDYFSIGDQPDKHGALAALERAFTKQAASHPALAAAAAATGALRFDDLAPLLDLRKSTPRRPTSASSSTTPPSSNAWPLLAPKHIDGGLLTVIYSISPGLQIRTPGGGWIDIAPATAQQPRLVILVAAQLESETGGALKAAEHRVVQTESPSNLPRMSLVFKLRTSHTALLGPLALKPKIHLPTPLLDDDPEAHNPTSVADFEAAFARSHPSITYGGLQRVVTPAQGSMRIFIKTTVGGLCVEPSDMVEAVKDELHYVHDAPPKQQLLYLDGQRMMLEDERTLMECGVMHRSELHLRLRLLGD